MRNPGQRTGMLGTVAHEFFHAWNMERIRPRDLEPFNFEEADVSGELWFGEGFTSYYDDLIMRRTGLAPLEQTLGSFAGMINTVTLSPARQFRSAEEMSRLAPFVDAAAAIDRTSWDNTFISYYTFGAALGPGDSISRCAIGRTAARRSTPTCERCGRGMDARAEDTRDGGDAVHDGRSEDRAGRGQRRPRVRATTFFARYIQGHDVVDYAPLLARAGLVLRKRNRRPRRSSPAAQH